MADSIQDDILATMKELEEPEKKEPEATAAPEAKNDQTTAETDAGKNIQQADGDKTTVEEPKNVPGSTETTTEASKAPSSWTPALREKWADLPKEFQDEILRRESASAEGVRKLREEFAPLQQAVGPLNEFIGEIQGAGQDPGQYMARTMAAERNLRNPDVNVRFGQLLEIADTYGIPLRQALNTLAGRELVPNQPAPQAPQIPQHVQQELTDLRGQNEAALRKEFDAFVANPKNEFFQDVREDMALLMERGVALTLDDAYAKACAMNSGVQQVIQGRAAKEMEQKIRQSQAAGASGSDNGRIDTGDTRKDDELSLDELVRRQVMAAQSSRI